MSPVANWLTQSQYRTSSGRSSPSWWLRLATLRASASGPRIARPTSPGRSWPAANTSTLSSQSVATARAARLASSAPTLTAASVIAVGRGGDGLGLLDAIDENALDEFVVEADEPLDARRLVYRVRVVPDQVLVALAVDGQMVIARDALVWAARDVAARTQHVEPRVRNRQIVARRHPRLEEKDAAARIGDNLAVDEDLDVARGRQAI